MDKGKCRSDGKGTCKREEGKSNGNRLLVRQLNIC